ncbi:hypothetical protein Patl1_20082 [Pistacia atlantica]|uniref:Uncharacterized protein n=1 Tax=Pistacia atlantica TaxID=434234 RepID=A0ACC1BHB1_9ROSI|nr:hypothetical protein Patl1_20082 [Pistacia atlantica]
MVHLTPSPGSPCCDAITTLNLIADSPDNRPSHDMTGNYKTWSQLLELQK